VSLSRNRIVKTNFIKMKNIFLILFILFFSGCKNEKKAENNDSLTRLKIEKKVLKNELEESFKDSTKIGLKGEYKIDLKKFRSSDSVYVEIKLYKKQKSKWTIIQSLEFVKDGILSCDPEIKDFNNDGLNDFTFQSSIAGRGANIIRKLFVFEKESGKLKFIKNSENFPNIRYNIELDCIDAFRVYGGAQTAFAKIEKDTLREFANVEIYDDTIQIKIIDKSGKEKLLKNEKYEGGYFHRFKNYKPLIENVDTK
jgi:hypothetical protein